MRSVKVLLCICLLVPSLIMLGCQESDPALLQDDLGLAGEMKSWFAATDYQASGYGSLEEALEGIYQDEGHTVSLYQELETLVNEATASGAAYDGAFQKCQQWFEMIDHESSGYDSLEEAIKDIYQDDGETLELYRKLIARNAL